MHPLPFVAAPGIYYYSSELTNNTYILNQFVSNFSKAQQFCNDNGGHLVDYASKDEQQDVRGALSPQPSKQLVRPAWLRLHG